MKKKTKSQIITFENFRYDSYEKVRDKIAKKVGKKPKLPDDLQVGEWTEQALKVLKERYLKRDEEGNILESPEELCWRVSWEVASAEAIWGETKAKIENKAREFYGLLVSRNFLPNSPTLMNAGANNNLQYSGCFVLPVEDSLVGIFDAIKYQALIHQSGGGTGFSFSRLRPNGSLVKSSRGTASGPVSFMKIFDSATNEIKQGGRRRGANMGMLRIDHPDIKEFIHCKTDGGISNFNISVAVTDKFMEAYRKRKSYDLVDPRTGRVTGSLNAKEVFDRIAQSAWENGDPGLIFIDRINKSVANPVPSLGPIEATNPCGEQPLYAYDSCNLGSIFVNYFLVDKKGKKDIDWDRLGNAIRLAVEFLDNVIEVNPYPLEQIRKTSLAIRRIGLGIGGWADLLVELQIPYDSQEALHLAEKLMKFIHDGSEKASELLSQKRGTFPLWEQSIYKNKKKRRNATITTIAPTGSISIIAGTSSGIEPLFAIAYQHIVKDKGLDRQLNFINPKFEENAKEMGFWSQDIGEKLAQKGILKDIDGIPQKIKQIFTTAHQIDPSWHIKIQAAFQKYTDNAVSKTINLNNSASVADVKKAYLEAWETGCKGITIFRDGSKNVQVLNMGIKSKKEEGKPVDKDNGEPLRERPFKVIGVTYRMATPVGSAFITINQDENGDPLELFINVGKAGSDVAAMAEALGRTISTAVRFKGFLTPKDRIKEIAHQLSGIGGRRSVGFGPNKVLSLPDAISVALSNHYGLNGNGKSHFSAGQVLNASVDPNDKQPDGEHKVSSGPKATTNKITDTDFKKENSLLAQNNLENYYEKPGDICPSCGAGALVYEEGCSKCHVCGHSEC